MLEVVAYLRKLTGSQRHKFFATDINRAAALVELVLQALPAEDLTTSLFYERLNKYAGANDSVRRKWKLHLGPWLSFEEAKSASEYKSMQHFAAMLKRNGYPKALLKEQLNHAGSSGVRTEARKQTAEKTEVGEQAKTATKQLLELIKRNRSS